MFNACALLDNCDVKLLSFGYVWRRTLKVLVSIFQTSTEANFKEPNDCTLN